MSFLSWRNSRPLTPFPDQEVDQEEGIVLPLEELDVALLLHDPEEELAELLALEDLLAALDPDLEVLGDLLDDPLLVGPLLLEVEDLPAAGDLVERRLGDVDVALLDQGLHVAVEEGHEERPDVGAVHVGVGHDDDLVVAELLQARFLLADRPCPGRRSCIPISSLLKILSRRAFQTLRILPLRGRMAWKRRSRPCLAEPPAESPSTMKISDRAGSRSWQSASFPGSEDGFEDALAAGQLAGLAGRFAGPGGVERLEDDPLGVGRVLLEVGRQLLVDERFDDALDLGVAELGLGLALELGVAHLDAEDGGQALAGVVAREGAGAQVLEQVVGHGVVVDAAGQGGLEADEVRAALVRVDVVDEGEDRLGSSRRCTGRRARRRCRPSGTRNRSAAG